jgi:TolB-like protein
MGPKVYGPSPDEVRAQLAKILADKIFIRSERLRRFLVATVERTLAGETQHISEYTLGREVFDRNKNYDPRIDSIVRVEARRLRAKLTKYYQDSGATDPVVIEFHQGSYVPGFRYAATPLLPSAALNPRTVAVLPFLNISDDPGQELFCDGITEEVLNALTAVPELSVVARTSVFYFKGANIDVREIGARLGAGTVIEGSVRKVDHSLRISVKVVNASTGLLLWSGNFDRELADVFTLQSEIAGAIANTLRVTLAPAHPQAANLEAYTFYLKGRYYWNQMSQEAIQAALQQFANAIALYPDYAPPYAALADAYGHLTVWERFRRAKARRAPSRQSTKRCASTTVWRTPTRRSVGLLPSSSGVGMKARNCCVGPSSFNRAMFMRSSSTHCTFSTAVGSPRRRWRSRRLCNSIPCRLAGFVSKPGFSIISANTSRRSRLFRGRFRWTRPVMKDNPCSAGFTFDKAGTVRQSLY